ncbi:MAG: hypothetical protein ACOCUJ_04020, partial [Thiohalospira sp.]
MKIRRISADDMRSAMRQVKDELGPEAVILSSNRGESGVELVAAVEVEDGDTAALAAAQSGAGGDGSGASESSAEAGSFSSTLSAAAAPEEATDGLTYGRPRPARAPGNRSGGGKKRPDTAPADPPLASEPPTP